MVRIRLWIDAPVATLGASSAAAHAVDAIEVATALRAAAPTMVPVGGDVDAPIATLGPWHAPARTFDAGEIALTPIAAAATVVAVGLEVEAVVDNAVAVVI
jgi:hypothetical protein